MGKLLGALPIVLTLAACDEKKAAVDRYHGRAVIVGPASLKVAGRETRMTGVRLPDFGPRCGPGYPTSCAEAAHRTLVARVEGKIVECVMSAQAAACGIPAEDLDLGALLMRIGLAEGAAPRYDAAERAAKREAAGFWSIVRAAELTRKPAADAALAAYSYDFLGGLVGGMAGSTAYRGGR